eukprot:3934832-Rhodomonas_salina.3
MVLRSALAMHLGSPETGGEIKCFRRCGAFKVYWRARALPLIPPCRSRTASCLSRAVFALLYCAFVLALHPVPRCAPVQLDSTTRVCTDAVQRICTAGVMGLEQQHSPNPEQFDRVSSWVGRERRRWAAAPIMAAVCYLWRHFSICGSTLLLLRVPLYSCCGVAMRRQGC